jgi:hypothetical protein
MQILSLLFVMCTNSQLPIYIMENLEKKTQYNNTFHEQFIIQHNGLQNIVANETFVSIFNYTWTWCL